MTSTTHVPVKEEVVTPRRFLEILKHQRDKVKKTGVIPPRLGRGSDFGKIKVSYRVPVVRSKDER
jgi:hypothetical protein